jgi:hypothetical protein
LSGVDPTPFHLLPALSGIPLGGAQELDTEYTAYLSSTMRVGMRVPILYMRQTKGAAGDYAFDPDWDIEHRCGDRRIAEDSLTATLEHAVAKQLPVLLTLNGGIWADAACDVPAWDINDRLEQDLGNCQWNEKNEVMPDDARKDLPGSLHAPELGRSLTFNVYARDVQRYKRRNLQQAGTAVVAFMRAHPTLFVGVSLDPDTYLNPFFNEQQWYDYNPGTLKQFRQWLAGSGPYAGAPETGVPWFRRIAAANRFPSPRSASSPARRSRRGTTSIRRARSRAIPRIRSGTIHGCASGRCFAAISFTCITMSWRCGSPKSACHATGSGRRKDSWHPPAARCRLPSPSTVPSRITIPAECPSKARSRRTVIWVRFFTARPR